LQNTKYTNGLPTYEHVHDLQVINGQGDNPEVVKGERFEENDFILFKSIEVEFTCGYITADCYMATIDKAVVMDAPKWSDRCSFDL